MKKANKIVIDTNVWLSYFLSKRFDLLAQLILDSEYEIVTSEALITEIKEVITRPKFKKQITLPIETYITFHEQLTICKYIEKKFTGSPDPKDDFLFDLALQTNAKILVTGDKKLLDWQDSVVEIITLAKFKQLAIKK